jgi:hypothetical protein
MFCIKQGIFCMNYYQYYYFKKHLNKIHQNIQCMKGRLNRNFYTKNCKACIYFLKSILQNNLINIIGNFLYYQIKNQAYILYIITLNPKKYIQSTYFRIKSTLKVNLFNKNNLKCTKGTIG